MNILTENRKQKLIEELIQLGFNIESIQPDVLHNALTYGYKIINNHFMAYTDNTNTWYIDKWF